MDDEFTTRVLDCMFFNSFVTERGPAWRSCDQWDELYCNMNEQLRSEAIDDGRLILTHIQVQHIYIYLYIHYLIIIYFFNFKFIILFTKYVFIQTTALIIKYNKLFISK